MTSHAFPDYLDYDEPESRPMYLDPSYEEMSQYFNTTQPLAIQFKPLMLR